MQRLGKEIMERPDDEALLVIRKELQVCRCDGRRKSSREACKRPLVLIAVVASSCSGDGGSSGGSCSKQEEEEEESFITAPSRCLQEKRDRLWSVLAEYPIKERLQLLKLVRRLVYARKLARFLRVLKHRCPHKDRRALEKFRWQGQLRLQAESKRQLQQLLAQPPPSTDTAPAKAAVGKSGTQKSLKREASPPPSNTKSGTQKGLKRDASPPPPPPTTTTVKIEIPSARPLATTTDASKEGVGGAGGGGTHHRRRSSTQIVYAPVAPVVEQVEVEMEPTQEERILEVLGDGYLSEGMVVMDPRKVAMAQMFALRVMFGRRGKGEVEAMTTSMTGWVFVSAAGARPRSSWRVGGRRSLSGLMPRWMSGWTWSAGQCPTRCRCTR